MASVTSNVPLLMYIEPCVTEGSRGPGTLDIGHSPPMRQGFTSFVNTDTHTHNPVDHLRAPRRRVVTSSEKYLNS